MALQKHFYRIILLQSLLIFVVATTNECLDTETLHNAKLNVGVAAGQTKFKAFEVPPLSTDLSVYSYAFEHAFIVLPSQCVNILGLQPNVADSDGITDKWMGRMGDLVEAQIEDATNSLDTALSSCACGWAIFLHGSGGFTYDNPRYTINMAGAGYGVIVPDSFASPTLGLRYKAPIKNLAAYLRKLANDDSTHGYWCSNSVYEPTSDCTPAVMNQSTSPSYPLCYSSNADNIISHPRDYQIFYERVFQLRKLELDYVVENLPIYMKTAAKLFLAGESEGGMVAARYFNSKLEPLLENGGRIILQWSCEWCYYVSCPTNARVGSGQANRSTPVLNLISHVDPFFGPKNSVASHVANGQGGYGNAKQSGNCFNQLQAQGFEHAYVLQDIMSPYHGLTETTGNLVRTVLFSFMAKPRSPFVLTALGADVKNTPLPLCTDLQWDGGLMYARCNELGQEKTVKGVNLSQCAYSGYQYHTQYHLLGGYEKCGALAQMPTTGYGSRDTKNMEFMVAGIVGFMVAVCLGSLLYIVCRNKRSKSFVELESDGNEDGTC